MIRIKNLHVFYQTERGPVHAVRGIDVDIQAGSIFYPARPERLRQNHDPALGRGLETPQQGQIFVGDDLVFSSTEKTSCRPMIATSAWCFSPTRFGRT